MLSVTDQAHQWATRTWQENQTFFSELQTSAEEKWTTFSMEDLLSFEKLRNFDPAKAWQSISRTQTTEGALASQALAKVLESVVITGYNMGFWLLLLTLIMAAVTVRRW